MDEQHTAPEQEDELFGGLDPQVQEDVDGLIWLGHLEHSFDFCGHNFVIRTLKGDEELNAGLVTKEYAESFGQARAWAWARIALALVAVDGDENFCPPIGPDRKAYARARFQYVTQNWYWPLAEYIYSQLVDLESRQLAAIRAVQDLSERSLTPFTPFADSSTDKGDSQDENSTPSKIDS